MLKTAVPKLPMRNKIRTKNWYQQLGFNDIGAMDYPDYLILRKDAIELHFFAFPALNPLENYGQIYIHCTEIEAHYKQIQEQGISIHPNAPLQQKPWGKKEFALLDPDNNLLTFGD
ncbi:MAG: VOC family protein [Bacteroidetes bacterium]|nr:VOC family protein [Bacteroidota bacterium]